MNTSSLLIGLFLVLLCIIPVWLFQRTQTKATRTLKKSFKQLAATNNLAITESDIWHNIYSIGIDNSKNKLLYLKHTESGDLATVADVSDLDKCIVERKIQQTGSGRHSIATVQHLDLVLTYRDSPNHKDVLEFYDESLGTQMNGESMLIEKWQKLIADRFAAKSR